MRSNFNAIYNYYYRKCNSLKMKLLHQAEPTGSNFSVNGWTIQLSGPGWISDARPAVRLIVLSHVVLPEVLHRARTAADKKDYGYAEPSCRATNACQLQPPGTTIPKWDKGKKIPIITPVLSSVFSKWLWQRAPGCFASWRGSGRQSSSTSKVEKRSCHTHLYM